MTKIAVLISTYNGEKYLEPQLDSILSQKGNFKLDLYIRDDGSKDRTTHIIKEYQKHYPNISLNEAKNVGCNASFFELLKNTSGYDYYAFSDQDDVWLNDKLASAITMLKKEPDDRPLLYASCSQLVDNNMKELGLTQQKTCDITLYNTIIQNILPGHTQVMNEKMRKAIIKSDIDASKIYYYDSWITNVAAVEGKIIFDNKPHTFYRQHANNEIGYGDSKLGWYKERIRRIKKNQTKTYSRQIDYFIEKYQSAFTPTQKSELRKYQESKQNLLERLRYIAKTKLYRQRPFETKLFKLMYLAGLY